MNNPQSGTITHLPLSRQVVIVDDHALFRHGIALLINSLNVAWNLKECASLAELEQLTISFKPDLILLDLHLQEHSPAQLLERIESGVFSAPVIVVSADDKPARVREAIDAGAMSFISKASSYQELINTMGAVLGYKVHLPPSIKTSNSISQDEKLRINDVLDDLTDRQREILWYLVQGQPNKKIASNLGVSEFTVKGHITRILSALNVKNRTEAVYTLAAAEVNVARVSG